jgi:purine nucleoside permease
LLRQKYETLDAQTNVRLNAYAASDRAMLTQDIARQRPDVILVERAATFMRWWHGPEGSRAPFDWANWANSDPMLAQQLEHYREYKTVDDVLILRREDNP